MPLYEYQCQSCGSRIEVMQRFSDPPKTVCETCGGELRKLVSAPAFQFKGSGWYLTDYARKGSEGTATKEGAAKEGTAKEGTVKETKAASSGTSEGGESAGKAKESSSAAKPGAESKSNKSTPAS